MELSELENLWNEYDSKLAENIKINKKILRNMLIQKPVKTLSLMRIRILFQIVACILIVIFFFKEVKLRDPGFELYTGLILISLLLFFSLFRALKYIAMLRSVSLIGAVLPIRERLIKIERFKLLTAKYNFIITPPSILAVILIAPVRFNQQQIIIPTLILILAYLIVSYSKMNGIEKEFLELNSQLVELEQLEEEDNYPV